MIYISSTSNVQDTFETYMQYLYSSYSVTYLRMHFILKLTDVLIENDRLLTGLIVYKIVITFRIIIFQFYFYIFWKYLHANNIKWIKPLGINVNLLCVIFKKVPLFISCYHYNESGHVRWMIIIVIN